LRWRNQLELSVEHEVERPLKRDERRALQDAIVACFRDRGASKVEVRDTYYGRYETGQYDTKPVSPSKKLALSEFSFSEAISRNHN